MYIMFENVNTVPKIPIWAEMQISPSHTVSSMTSLTVSLRKQTIKTQAYHLPESTVVLPSS